jgi:hypothetical protein
VLANLKKKKLYDSCNEVDPDDGGQVMGFNPPVPQQDSNWEIRAAVLLSLFFQVLLIFLGPTWKRSSVPLFRLTLWSSYLLADWVADLALDRAPPQQHGHHRQQQWQQ